MSQADKMQRPKNIKKKKWKQMRKKDRPTVLKASHRYARISPRKARLVIDLIRGRHVNDAKMTLQFTNKRAAHFVEKVLKSALANAEDHINRKKLDIDTENLYVKEAWVDEGPTMKRWLPRARGHATPIFKRTCHIHIVLDEILDEQEIERREQEQQKKKSKKKGGAKKGGKSKKKDSEKKDSEQSDKSEEKESSKKSEKSEKKDSKKDTSEKKDSKKDTKSKKKDSKKSDSKKSEKKDSKKDTKSKKKESKKSDSKKSEKKDSKKKDSKSKKKKEDK